MGAFPPSRRGRCPHRPETLWAEMLRINVPLCYRTPGPMWASAPTRWTKCSVCTHRYRPSGCGPMWASAPTRGTGFSVGIGPYAVDGGFSGDRLAVGLVRPTPVRAFGPATLSQERVFRAPRRWTGFFSPPGSASAAWRRFWLRFVCLHPVFPEYG